MSGLEAPFGSASNQPLPSAAACCWCCLLQEERFPDLAAERVGWEKEQSAKRKAAATVRVGVGLACWLPGTRVCGLDCY